jgi:hypothetical protein
MGTINSRDRIAATLCSLGTLFVSGIPFIKEIVVVMMIIIIIIIWAGIARTSRCGRGFPHQFRRALGRTQPPIK